MNVKELRIGNYVTVINPKYYPEIKGKILKVIGINETTDIDGNERTYTISMNYLDKNIASPIICQFITFIYPIKLTEKVLLDLGFLEYGKSYHIGIACDHFSVSKVGGTYEDWYFSNEFFKTKIIASNLRNIHELQNLYFFLTSKELKLTTTSL